MSTAQPVPPPLGSIQPPDDRALQLLHEAEISGDLNCHQVGTIQSFNPANQTATVGINMTRQIAGAAVTYPVLITCPVFVLKGGGASITFPIAAGDECLVLFNDRDIDNWWQSAQTNLTPNSPRVHSLSDGFVLVGVSSLPKVDSAYDSTRAQFKMGGAVVEVFSSGGRDILTVSILGGNTWMQLDSGSPANGRVNLKANGMDVTNVFTTLFTALFNWQNTGGTVPNATTIAALNNAQTVMQTFFV